MNVGFGEPKSRRHCCTERSVQPFSYSSTAAAAPASSSHACSSQLGLPARVTGRIRSMISRELENLHQDRYACVFEDGGEHRLRLSAGREGRPKGDGYGIFFLLRFHQNVSNSSGVALTFLRNSCRSEHGGQERTIAAKRVDDCCCTAPGVLTSSYVPPRRGCTNNLCWCWRQPSCHPLTPAPRRHTSEKCRRYLDGGCLSSAHRGCTPFELLQGTPQENRGSYNIIAHQTSVQSRGALNARIFVLISVIAGCSAHHTRSSKLCDSKIVHTFSERPWRREGWRGKASCFIL